MKSLIRFEDTYGLTDIFCAQHKIPYLDISKKQQRMIQVTSELFVDFGLASGWTSISNNEAYALMERGIERVIFVYDMDNLKGDKTKILSRESLSSVIKNNRLLFENLAYSIELYYVPVVYAAETIMLYQYLDEKYDISVTSLVNSINTNAQHLYLLAYLINENNFKEAKKVRNFLNIDELVTAIEKQSSYDINKNLKNWISEGCLDDSQYLYSGIEAQQHRDKTEEYFLKYKNNSARYIQIDKHLIRLDATPKPLLSRK